MFTASRAILRRHRSHLWDQMRRWAVPLALWGCQQQDAALIEETARRGSVNSAIIDAESSASLPPCTAGNQGQVYHVTGEAAFYYCDHTVYQSVAIAADPADLLDVVPADSQCPSGGVVIRAGLDQNRDEQLDASEVATQTPICNGNNGTKGADGTNGSSCSVRDNGDHTKTIACGDGGSVTVADGIAGAAGLAEPVGADPTPVLVRVVPEPIGSNCALGGHRVDVGFDKDSSGVLDVAEITGTSYACVTPLPTGADAIACNCYDGTFTQVLACASLDCSSAEQRTSVCTAVCGNKPFAVDSQSCTQNAAACEREGKYSVTLASAADLAQLANVSGITGTLSIQGLDALPPLNLLRRVGSLEIASSQLTNIDGNSPTSMVWST
jgi:hypothetical protein